MSSTRMPSGYLVSLRRRKKRGEKAHKQHSKKK